MLLRKIPLLGLASLLAACVGPDAYFRGADIGDTGGSPGTGVGGGVGTGNGGVAGSGSGGVAASGNGGGGGGGGMIGSGSGGAVSGGAGMGGRGGSTATTGSGGTTGGAGGGAGTTASGTLLLSDTFEPGTNDGKHSWISPDTTIGSWSLFPDGTNTVFREGTVVSSEVKSISGNSAWTDQAIEVKTRVTGGDLSSVRVMVYGRYQDDKNYFFLELSQSQLKVRKKIAGSSVDIGRYKFPSGTMLALNTWYTIKLVIAGSVITGYFNGMPTTPTADMSTVIAAGGIGVGVNDGSADFDDVKVTTP